ncbi:peroxiredoxin family protein [Thermophagus xiamenensis]|jgi:peroxiredoxin|uniref:Peroxiredoxin n=1 Tax=Thermophagus xiamenensis TaxID=385682 RepID=A0A1I1VPT7_9BACT|nr:redoxin domain-containing protein [Thermophagus xiamenensis]SFD82520.1 Peroxiredoxin [Thermophagus xiamenensis]
MKLQSGNNAIDFTAQDIHGKEIRLSNYRGQKIILSFFRNVNCPFCNRRVHQLMFNNIHFKNAGVQLVLLFESSNEKLLSSSFHRGISPWPLIGDPEKKIYKLYGVEQSTIKMMKTMFVANLNQAKKETKELNLPQDKDASMNLIPADFLIDENFKIVKAHYGKHLDDHIDFNELKAFAGIGNQFKKTS